MSEDNKFHYLTREHQHNDGTKGRDLYTTDRMATLNNDTSREYGLPKAQDQDIGQKDHLVKDRDY